MVRPASPSTSNSAPHQDRRVQIGQDRRMRGFVGAGAQDGAPYIARSTPTVERQVRPRLQFGAKKPGLACRVLC